MCSLLLLLAAGATLLVGGKEVGVPWIWRCHYKVPRDREWACGLIRDNGLAVFTAFAAFLAAIASVVAAVAALGE